MGIKGGEDDDGKCLAGENEQMSRSLGTSETLGEEMMRVERGYE